MACGGMIFIKKNSNFRRKKIFIFFIKFFKSYYCSIKIKRRSEPSGLRPDTSNLVNFMTAQILAVLQILRFL